MTALPISMEMDIPWWTSWRWAWRRSGSHFVATIYCTRSIRGSGCRWPRDSRWGFPNRGLRSLIRYGHSSGLRLGRHAGLRVCKRYTTVKTVEMINKMSRLHLMGKGSVTDIEVCAFSLLVNARFHTVLSLIQVLAKFTTKPGLAKCVPPFPEQEHHLFIHSAYQLIDPSTIWLNCSLCSSLSSFARIGARSSTRRWGRQPSTSFRGQQGVSIARPLCTLLTVLISSLL